MKTWPWLLVLCSALVLGGVVVVPATASVSDARLVISETTVSPQTPSADERVSITFTLENSAGSNSAVSIDSVELQSRSRFSSETYASADSLGALSPGDDVSLSIPVTFDQSDAYDLELVVEGTDENGDSVSVTRPVSVDVGSAADDLAVSAERLYIVETDDGETAVGGIEELIGAGGGANDVEPTPALEIRVSNFGAAAARDVFVEPAVNGEQRARLPVSDVPRNGSVAVRFATESITEEATIEFTVGYRLSTDAPGGERRTATTTYEYRPGADSLVITDVSMERDGDRLSITGNAGNIGSEQLRGTVVQLDEAANITPAAPQRDYFIGTVPDSDFVTFDLTARVDGDPETVPISVQYRADGVIHEAIIELPYDPAPASGSGDGRSLGWMALLVVGGGAVAIGTGGYLWRRRTNERD